MLRIELVLLNLYVQKPKHFFIILEIFHLGNHDPNAKPLLNSYYFIIVGLPIYICL